MRLWVRLLQDNECLPEMRADKVGVDVRRVWDRHRSMTFWEHDLPSALLMPPAIRSRWWWYKFKRVPWVWWDVSGRKWLATQHSTAIRRSWKLGNYGR